MRTSGEKVRKSEGTECVQTVSYPQIRSLLGIKTILLSLMPTEETGETRVSIDCLNFDVPVCIQITKQISIRGRWHWDYIFVGF